MPRHATTARPSVKPESSPRHHRVAVVAALLLAGCATVRAVQVTPADIPALEARVQEHPDDAVATLRLGAAHLAAGDCDRALPLARRGMAARPADALGPLVAGECLERGSDIPAALAVYDAFTRRHASSRGGAAVSARALLARRTLASARARELLAAEPSMPGDPVDRNVLAVLPLVVSGDSAYAPLATGLASMLSSDLALVARFRLVERLEIRALIDELRLQATGIADTATAARTGRIMRAGTVVAGVATIPAAGPLRLDVQLVDPASRVTGAESVEGAVRDILRLEKDLVLEIAAAMGYQLSAAERNAILDNGTRDLAAFLAFSRGLVQEDAGNYAAAAAHFSQALVADPGFRQAREAFRAASAAPAVQSAGAGGAAGLAATTVSEAAPAAPEPVAGAATAGVQDLAPTAGERLGGGSTGQQAATTATSAPAPATTGVVSQAVLFAFRFVLRFP